MNEQPAPGQPQKNRADDDVIYAFRTVNQKQTQLLVLADQKANIVIGLVTVVLTLSFTNTSILTTIQGWLFVPALIFVLMELTALCFALLVIMPKTTGKMTGMKIEDIPNPFFFGFFTEFEEHDYLQYLVENLNNNQAARYFLSKDLYQTGLILKQKYRLLRHAYLWSVLGIVLLLLTALMYIVIQP